jgi:hypothetical protein
MQAEPPREPDVRNDPLTGPRWEWRIDPEAAPGDVLRPLAELLRRIALRKRSAETKKDRAGADAPAR